jgi:HSP20 family protein
MNTIDLWRSQSMPSSLLNDIWNWADDVDSPMIRRKNGSKDHADFEPACDVEASDSQYVLSLDMPGIGKDEMNVEVEGSHLVVYGERKSDESFEGNSTNYKERTFGAFRRNFAIPDDVDTNAIEANHQNGVLKISIPKSKRKKAKKIEINSGSKGHLKRLTNQKKEVKTANQ